MKKYYFLSCLTTLLIGVGITANPALGDDHQRTSSRSGWTNSGESSSGWTGGSSSEGGSSTGSSTGGTTGGSTGGTTGGTTGGINAATALTATCLNCHGDRRSRVDCTNTKWTAHNGTRVSTAVYDAVTQYLTGSVCGSGNTGGTTGGTTGGSTGGTTGGSTGGSTAGTPVNSDYIVVGTNDLGMHCVCLTFDKFMLLPPFNTLRAQVIKRGEEPSVIADPSKVRVEYNIVEDTKATLDADPYYQSWIENAPKLFPGFDPIDRSTGEYQGLTGAKLKGEMEAKSTEGWWEITGVPAYPNIDSKGIMTDPLGGPNRNPFLTANIKVYDQGTNKLLAETNTVAPAAFGGCCECHIDVAGKWFSGHRPGFLRCHGHAA